MHQNFDLYNDQFKDVFRYQQGQRIIDIRIPYKEQDRMCPSCCQIHLEGGIRKDCDWVYGRRGWRQLGVYDG